MLIRLEVVFELRGKPFGLEDGRAATEYQLCRAWMRGKSEDVPLPKPLEMPPLEIPVVSFLDRKFQRFPIMIKYAEKSYHGLNFISFECIKI